VFKRGFKAWCERTAVALRTKRGLAPSVPLPARLLGEELSVEILALTELETLDAECARRLAEEHAECWSAITLPGGGRPLIVYNHSHSPARQNSDLMHELSHLLLNHEPGMTFVDPNSGLAIRAHDKSQEEEAAWLSGCLLLPREALLRIKRMKLTPEKACEIYLVSLQMLTYRMNTSGVNIQQRRAQRSF
jgi:IrrE N-terminal-like domain